MSLDNKRSLHLKILQSVSAIESWDLAKRCEIMDNTSNKYVKYLRDEGHKILTEKIDGKPFCRYRYVSAPSMISDSEEVLIQKCLEVAAEYPEDHPQRAKIMQEYEKLMERKRMVA